MKHAHTNTAAKHTDVPNHTAKPPSPQAVKVCVDPQCWEVAHNFTKGVVYCRTCGGRMIGLDKETYQREYILSPHQFDYSKDEDDDCRVNPYEIGYKYTGKSESSQLSLF